MTGIYHGILVTFEQAKDFTNPLMKESSHYAAKAIQ